MPKAKMLVSPEVLERLLELPGDVQISGAETALHLNGQTQLVALRLEGEGVPGGAELVEAQYTKKSSFDRLEPCDDAVIRDGRLVIP